MSQKKIAYIISFVNKSLSFEWTVSLLNKNKYQLTFILLNNRDSSFEDFLKAKGVNVFRINYNGKKDIPLALVQTIKILKKQKIDIVHAHLFDACLIGLISAKIAGIKKRIHTRHNATIHHQYHQKAVKYDKYINLLSTDIVAISENVKNILIEMEHVNPKKIIIIHHGFDFNDFENISQKRIDAVIKRHCTSSKPTYPTIGIISRYIHWKGIQYIIPAFKKIIAEYPNAHLVLANANGPYKTEIRELLKEIPRNNFTEIEFEEDIFALYKLFDIFIHTPIDEKSEAFGQVYVETMASGVPSIITASGIAPEFIVHRENALLVPFKDTDSIQSAIHELLDNDLLKQDIIRKGRNSVAKMFNLNLMIQKLENLYDR